MPDRRFKSGMGTDIDPIRLGLVTAALLLSLVSIQQHNAKLMAVALFFVAITAWYITRTWYLDVIDGLKDRLDKLEKEQNGGQA